MDNKVYVVQHLYDVDGGFGDAIMSEDVLFVTRDESVAKEYCERYSRPFVYDKPYADLSCGYIEYYELPLKGADVLNEIPDLRLWGKSQKRYNYLVKYSKDEYENHLADELLEEDDDDAHRRDL